MYNLQECMQVDGYSNEMDLQDHSSSTMMMLLFYNSMSLSISRVFDLWIWDYKMTLRVELDQLEYHLQEVHHEYFLQM